MQDTIIFPPVISTKPFKIKPVKTYLKPSPLGSLSPRSYIRSRVKFNKKPFSIEDNIPEIVSIAALSKDLVSPYTLKTKQLAKSDHGQMNFSTNSIKLPSLPTHNYRLKRMFKREKCNTEQCLMAAKKEIIIRKKSHDNIKSSELRHSSSKVLNSYFY